MNRPDNPSQPVTDTQPIHRALISVTDKSGLDLLCPFLAEKGAQIFSTGGTKDYIEKTLKIPCQSVDSVTQVPEMLGGRVKTLHPKIFGGILARRENETDLQEVKKYEIPLFDLIVVNLYAFQEHLGKDPITQSGFIDIGGPSMLRAAAKNNRSVTVLSSPKDYPAFIEEMTNHKGTSAEFRLKMAAKVFQATAAYDAMIAAEWSKESLFPTVLTLAPQTPLRYGENPHQKGVWVSVGSQKWNCLQGKELSYNNLLDTEAAVRIVQEFATPAISIIKHNNPCGVASGEESLGILYERALACDSKSAFGGVVALNRPVTGELAEKMSAIFFEVILAPKFDETSKEIFSKKKNLRLIEWPAPSFPPFELRAALGGWLIQSADDRGVPTQFEVITDAKVTSESLRSDLTFAWLVAKHVRSNAIVLAKNGATVGIGAGQMSRVDAVQVALQKAGDAAKGAVLASDAFFPFRDNIDCLKNFQIAGIIQPGGSQRDGEVVQACNELGIPMVFTAERHFRH